MAFSIEYPATSADTILSMASLNSTISAHRLCSAIEAYGLSGKVVNSHRAVDDVLATLKVMEEMEKEKPDLERYVNLFGYNPKYGIEGKPIGTVTYKPQPYDPIRPLYESGQGGEL